MRISDWSSDVCSSDLQVMVGDTTYDRIVLVLEGAAKGGVKAGRDGHVRNVHAKGAGDDTIVAETRDAVAAGHRVTLETGIASCRERLCHYLYLRVCTVSLKKNNQILTNHTTTT